MINKISNPNIEAPELNSSIPKEIREICKGLLHKDQDNRFDFNDIIKYKII